MNNFTFSDIPNSDEIFYCRCGRIVFLRSFVGNNEFSASIKVVYDNYETNLEFVPPRQPLSFLGSIVQKQESLKIITSYVTENDFAKKLVLFIPSLEDVTLIQHSVRMSFYDFNTKLLVASNVFGSFGKNTYVHPSSGETVPSLVFDLPSGGFNFYNSAIALVIESLCDNSNLPCCDQLPTRFTLNTDDICLPLDDFYTEQQINRRTTTTMPPLGIPCNYLNTQNIPSKYIPENKNVYTRRQS